MKKLMLGMFAATTLFSVGAFAAPCWIAPMQPHCGVLGIEAEVEDGEVKVALTPAQIEAQHKHEEESALEFVAAVEEEEAK